VDESSIRSKMQEVVDLVVGDIGTIRTGRATPTLVQDLEVEVYGGHQKLKINELATINSPGPESIIIDPWDKSIIGEIKKGIDAANTGLTPSIDGEIIRISVPPLTSEDRQKFIRLLSTKIESGKVMIRQVRGDHIQDIRKSFGNKEMSEDEKFNREKRLQEITDDFNEKLEEMRKKKEQELLQI